MWSFFDVDFGLRLLPSTLLARVSKMAWGNSLKLSAEEDFER